MLAESDAHGYNLARRISEAPFAGGVCAVRDQILGAAREAASRRRGIPFCGRWSVAGMLKVFLWLAHSLTLPQPRVTVRNHEW